MSFFSSEDDDADFILYLHNLIQKTIQPIHIPLSTCTYLSVPEMGLLAGCYRWWCYGCVEKVKMEMCFNH